MKKNMSSRLNCPHCSNAFQNKGSDKRMHNNYSRHPLLLKCGHSVCESCLNIAAKLHKYYKCQICNVQSDFPDGADNVSKLISSVYVLNLLTVKSQSFKNIELKSQVMKKPNSSSSHGAGSPVFCNECRTPPAAWNCGSCASSFCSSCWDKVHMTSKYMNKHKKKSLYEDNSSSYSEMTCKEHNRALEFFCDDDEQLACSYCAVMGPHKGHAIVALSQKNEECIDSLRDAVSTGVRIWNQLKTSQQKLASILSNTKQQHHQLKNSVQSEFLRLHGLLELREHMLMDELEVYCTQNMTHLMDMNNELLDNVKKVFALIKDGNKAVNGQKLVVNSFLLEKKLLSSKELPSYIIPACYPKESDSSISFNTESSFEELINKFGKLYVDKDSCYNLVDEESLPPEFVKENVIDENYAGITDGKETSSSISGANILDYCDNISQSSKSEILSASSAVSTPMSATNSNPFMSALKFSPADPIKYFYDDEVHVTHIVNPAEFWVKRTKDLKNLRTLSEQLNKQGRKRNDRSSIPTSVAVGELYVAQFSKDKKWYRGRVKSVPSNSDQQPQKALISFIDFGNSEMVLLDRLRKILDPKIFQFPEMAWHCRLFDIQPIDGSWHSESINMFFKLTADKILKMKVMERTNEFLSVDLLQAAHSGISSDRSSSVRDAMIFLNLAKFISNPTQLETMVQDINLNNTSKQKLQQENAPIVGNSSIVALCHVESVVSFFVQKQGANAKQLVQMMTDLQTVYNDSKTHSLSLLCPMKGSICAAQFSVDNQWYRSQVISDVESTSVKIKYVDYGNTEFVEIWKIKKLPDKFLVLPAQAIHCSLSDIAPVNNGEWLQEAAQFFVETAGDMKLKMIVQGNEDNVVNVAMYFSDPNANISVNSLLVREHHAISTGPSSQESQIEENSNVNSDIRSRSSFDSDANQNDNVYDVPPLNFEPSKRVRNKKIQNIRKKNLSSQMFPSSPEPVTVPVQPEHNSTYEKENEQKRRTSEYIPIILTHVESPSALYFKLKPDANNQKEDELTKMMHEIQIEYKQVVETGNVDWKIKEPCCVKCDQDKLWYRARIVEILDDKSVKVFLVDYGLTITVPVQNISILLEEFQIAPAFCAKCHLPSINAAGDGRSWSRVATEYLTELAEKYQEELYLIHNKDVEKVEGSVAVDLYIKEIVVGGALEPTKKSYINVAKKLVDEGLALPSRIYRKKIEKKSVDEVPIEDNVAAVEETVEQEVSNVECETVKASWKSPSIPSQKTFKCKPTYVDDNAGIHLHDMIKGENNLKVLTDAMQMKYVDSKPQAHDLYWLPGQLCIAKFFVDNKWYRGKVISIQNDGINVKFIDYGNEELLKHEDLRKDIIMTELPTQCFCCDLFELQPISADGKWPVKVLDFIHKSVVDKICTVTVESFDRETNHPKISLIIEPDMNLKDLLIDAKCAMEKEEEDDVVESITEIEFTLSDTDTFPPAFIPDTDEYIPVVITQMLTPCQVSIQKLQLKEDKLSDAMFEINAQYQRFLDVMSEMHENGKHWPYLSDIKEGSVCCGQYTHDDTWYRAEVLKVVGELQFLIRYVDYGNCEILSSDRMRVLPKDLIDFPVQAIPCMLHQLTFCGEEWSAETSAKMMNIFFNSDYSFYAKVKCKVPEVKIDLLIKDADGHYQLAYQSLIDDGTIALIREKRPEELL